MKLTMNDIGTLFPVTDFVRGMEYYRQGRVVELHNRQVGDAVWVEGSVRGSRVYRVMFRQVGPRRIEADCGCPRFADTGRCKHLVAAMIDCVMNSPKEFSDKSDYYARQLLTTYLEKSQRQPNQPQTPARLVPRIQNSYFQKGDSLIFTFQVGRDKLYIVKNIKQFLKSVDQRQTVSYGKALTLDHSIEQFDAPSRALIALLMDQYAEFRSIGWSRSTGDYIPYSLGKNEIILAGDAFDRFFALFLGQSVESRVGPIRFDEGDPQITVRLDKEPNHARLSLNSTGQYHFIGNSRQLYALTDGALLRCGDDFRERVYPMLSGGMTTMKLAYNDLPTFCGCVLPQIGELVTVEDPEELLREYLPDECTPCFYFDLEDELLTLKLTYRYGEEELLSETPVNQTGHVKQDLQTEQAALAHTERYFSGEQGRYVRSGEDEIFDFLTGALETFHRYGEVFVSDRLKNRRIRPDRASVGISVSEGMLELELDTGEFPPEELAALYQSLLRRKKYHRLADGRYLELNGSPYEKVAEMAHMLRLPEKELAEGKVTVPAFRSLYLDGLLSDSEGLSVTRDRQFRAMIRSFKTVEESDDTLPGHLEQVLRPYQKVGFRWLKTLESSGFGGILADEMGLGKTLQIIAYLASVDRSQTGAPSLVVCPTSLILNWGEELRRFAPELGAALILGNAAERKALRAASAEADVWVTSYELLRQDIREYEALRFYCCVLDEGQHIKNQSTLVSKAVKQINCRQRFVLTGTPIENRLSELWNLFDFLMPGYLFSHTAFRDKLEKPIVKSKNPEAADQLRRLVQPFLLRRLKKDVLKELPPKSEYIRPIRQSEEERKVYLAAVQAIKSSLGGEQGKLQILAALTQLRQICCDPGLCFENYEGPSAKLEACLELCAGMVENGHQILVFSQFTSMLDRLRLRLEEMGVSTFTLQGSTPKEKRAQLVKAFNAGKASVFLISLKAGGTGLNLTAADVVIHYDPWWNLAAQDQATDRAHRMGQRARVQVYKLIAKDTIEEKILNLQDKKAALMETVSGAGEGSILTMSKEELLALLE